MSLILKLARKNCSNYFDSKCLKYGNKCNVDKERCGYLEQYVIPGINRMDHPDYPEHKTGIRLYRDTIQTDPKRKEKEIGRILSCESG